MNGLDRACACGIKPNRNRIRDFLVRFLGVSQAMAEATKPPSRGSAPCPAGALEDARQHMLELRGEARQLIVQLGEETAVRANGPVDRPMPVLRHGRRPSWWQDAEVALLVTRLHRKVEIGQAVAQCRERFGIERAPSRSSLHRYWMKLDGLARELPR